MTTYAGRPVFPAFFTDPSGNPQELVSITIYNRGTVVKPTIYTSRTKATPLANPFTADSLGNAEFYVDPGEYDALCNGVTIPFSSVPDPVEPVDSAAVLAAIPSGTYPEVAENLADLDDTAEALNNLGGVSSGLRFWDRFTGRANGAVTAVAARSGDAWIAGPAGARAPIVTGGKLTFAGAGINGASYPSLAQDVPATRIGGRFTFSAGASDGSAVLVLWATDITGTFPTIPDSPIHLSITPTAWELTVWQANAFTSLRSGIFSTPLAQDGTTVHAAEVLVDRENSTAYLILPGVEQVVAVSHALIGSVAGMFATWESFKNATGSALASFVEVWADGRSNSGLPLAKKLATVPPPKTVVEYAPGSAAAIVMTEGASEFDATNMKVEFIFPESGRVVIAADFQLSMTGAATIYGALFTPGPVNVGLVEIVTGAQINGRVSFRKVLTGTPGAEQAVTIGGACTVAATATVRAWGPGGQPMTISAEAA